MPFQPWLRGAWRGSTPPRRARSCAGGTRCGAACSSTWHSTRKLEHSHADGSKDVTARAARGRFRQAARGGEPQGHSRSSSGLSSSGPTEWSDYGDHLQLLRRGHQGEGGLRPRGGASQRVAPSSGISAATTGGTPHRRGGIGLHHRPRCRPRRRRTALPSRSRAKGCQTILPLVGDVADPSPALGWRGRERLTLAGAWPARHRPCARAGPPPRDRAHDPAAASSSAGSPTSAASRRRVPRPRGRDGQRLLAAEARRLAPRLHTTELRGRAPARFEILARPELPSGTRRSTTPSTLMYAAAPTGGASRTRRAVGVSVSASPCSRC